MIANTVDKYLVSNLPTYLVDFNALVEMARSKVATHVEDVVLPRIAAKLNMIPNIKTLVSNARTRIGEIVEDVVLS